jgi:ABC-type multidrug transport system fused ATPase/permease subunit
LVCLRGWPSEVHANRIVPLSADDTVVVLPQPASGAIAIEIAGFWLADSFPNIWPIILGLLMVILFSPTGLIGLLVSEEERVGNFGRPPFCGARGGRTMPLLEVRGLIKAFGRLLALGGVDLTVRENEFHGLIGPNGSGKSTLMRCVAGAELATEGSMNRDRRSIDRVLEWFPKLAQRLGQPAGTLSVGERKMLAIGRAILSNPKLLLVP